MNVSHLYCTVAVEVGGDFDTTRREGGVLGSGRLVAAWYVKE
jgi:hypothetical protein